MKQLKFMLAAATAVGIAAAAQAGADAQYAASTGFEEQTVAEDATIGTGSDDYFYYGGNPSDNESKIIAASAPAGMDRRPYGTGYFTGDKVGTSKVLQVNTGTEPLLRSIATFNEAPVSQDLTADTYVDTLVQFTVTPGADSVDHTEGVDKLMVYLKEMTNGVGTVTGTNLVVKAGYLGAENPAEAIAKEYIVNTGTTAIVPGVWYRLTVKAIPNLATAASMYYPAFEVSINGNPCTFDTAAFDDTANNVIEWVLAVCGEPNFELLGNKSVVFSLCATGTAPASLKGVGFAGEGKVDDLIITTEDPDTPASTAVDFTLALGEGVSAVTYVIGSTEAETTEDVELFGSSVTIKNVDYVAGYTAGAVKASETPYAVTATGLTVDATKVVIDTTEGSATTAADLGINAESAFADATPTELQDLIAWTTANGVSVGTVNGMQFTTTGTSKGNPASAVGTPARAAEEAFLLNCAPSEVEDEKAEFVFSATDLAKLMDPNNTENLDIEALKETKKYIGELILEGATELGDWHNKAEGDTFFRARLVFPGSQD